MRSRTSPKKAPAPRRAPVPTEATFQYTPPATINTRYPDPEAQLAKIAKEDLMSFAKLQAKIRREMPKPRYDFRSFLEQHGYAITDGGTLVKERADYVPGRRFVPRVTIETLPLADYWTYQLTPSPKQTERKVA